MNEKKLILKRIGLNNPTEVEYGSKILVTNELDIKSLCDLWKWYFHLEYYKKIDLYMNERDFNAAKQRTFAGAKSVVELFFDNGFICKKLEPQDSYVSEWRIYRKSEIEGNKQ